MPRKGDRDPNKPKGRTSAYAFFVQDKKETDGQGMDFTQFSKFCSKEWKKITTDDKQRFVELSDEDRERYQREMAVYKSKDAPKVTSRAGGRKKKDSSLPKRNL